MLFVCLCYFFFSSRGRHTRCALVTGVQTCALPISSELSPGDSSKVVHRVPAALPKRRSCCASSCGLCALLRQRTACRSQSGVCINRLPCCRHLLAPPS